MKRLGLLTALLLLAGCATAPVSTVPAPATPAETPPAATPQPGQRLTGTRWVWFETVSGGSRLAAPKTGMYLLDFGANGFIRVTADCNRGSARYKYDSGKLEVSPAALTRMACPPGGQGARFAADLDRAESARLDGGMLALGLPGGGAMRLAPLKSSRYECDGGLRFGLVDLPGDDAAVEFDGRYFRAARVQSALGVAYEGTGVRFAGKGDEAQLDLGEQNLRGCKVKR